MDREPVGRENPEREIPEDMILIPGDISDSDTEEEEQITQTPFVLKQAAIYAMQTVPFAEYLAKAAKKHKGNINTNPTYGQLIFKVAIAQTRHINDKISRLLNDFPAIPGITSLIDVLVEKSPALLPSSTNNDLQSLKQFIQNTIEASADEKLDENATQDEKAIAEFFELFVFFSCHYLLSPDGTIKPEIKAALKSIFEKQLNLSQNNAEKENNRKALQWLDDWNDEKTALLIDSFVCNLLGFDKICTDKILHGDMDDFPFYCFSKKDIQDLDRLLKSTSQGSPQKLQDILIQNQDHTKVGFTNDAASKMINALEEIKGKDKALAIALQAKFATPLTIVVGLVRGETAKNMDKYINRYKTIMTYAELPEHIEQTAVTYAVLPEHIEQFSQLNNASDNEENAKNKPFLLDIRRGINMAHLKGCGKLTSTTHDIFSQKCPELILPKNQDEKLKPTLSEKKSPYYLLSFKDNNWTLQYIDPVNAKNSEDIDIESIFEFQNFLKNKKPDDFSSPEEFKKLQSFIEMYHQNNILHNLKDNEIEEVLLAWVKGNKDTADSILENAHQHLWHLARDFINSDIPIEIPFTFKTNAENVTIKLRLTGATTKNILLSKNENGEPEIFFNISYNKINFEHGPKNYHLVIPSNKEDEEKLLAANFRPIFENVFVLTERDIGHANIESVYRRSKNFADIQGKVIFRHDANSNKIVPTFESISVSYNRALEEYITPSEKYSFIEAESKLLKIINTPTSTTTTTTTSVTAAPNIKPNRKAERAQKILDEIKEIKSKREDTQDTRSFNYAHYAHARLTYLSAINKLNKIKSNLIKNGQVRNFADELLKEIKIIHTKNKTNKTQDEAFDYVKFIIPKMTPYREAIRQKKEIEGGKRYNNSSEKISAILQFTINQIKQIQIEFDNDTFIKSPDKAIFQDLRQKLEDYHASFSTQKIKPENISETLKEIEKVFIKKISEFDDRKNKIADLKRQIKLLEDKITQKSSESSDDTDDEQSSSEESEELETQKEQYSQQLKQLEDQQHLKEEEKLQNVFHQSMNYLYNDAPNRLKAFLTTAKAEIEDTNPNSISNILKDNNKSDTQILFNEYKNTDSYRPIDTDQGISITDFEIFHSFIDQGLTLANTQKNSSLSGSTSDLSSEEENTPPSKRRVTSARAEPANPQLLGKKENEAVEKGKAKISQAQKDKEREERKIELISDISHWAATQSKNQTIQSHLKIPLKDLAILTQALSVKTVNSYAETQISVFEQALKIRSAMFYFEAKIYPTTLTNLSNEEAEKINFYKSCRDILREVYGKINTYLYFDSQLAGDNNEANPVYPLHQLLAIESRVENKTTKIKLQTPSDNLETPLENFIDAFFNTGIEEPKISINPASWINWIKFQWTVDNKDLAKQKVFNVIDNKDIDNFEKISRIRRIVEDKKPLFLSHDDKLNYNSIAFKGELVCILRDFLEGYIDERGVYKLLRDMHTTYSKGQLLVSNESLCQLEDLQKRFRKAYENNESNYNSTIQDLNSKKSLTLENRLGNMLEMLQKSYAKKANKIPTDPKYKQFKKQITQRGSDLEKIKDTYEQLRKNAANHDGEYKKEILKNSLEDDNLPRYRAGRSGK